MNSDEEYHPGIMCLLLRNGLLASSKWKWTSHSTFRVKAPIFQSYRHYSPAASRRGGFLRQLTWVDLRTQNARSRNCNFDQKAPESQPYHRDAAVHKLKKDHLCGKPTLDGI